MFLYTTSTSNAACFTEALHEIIQNITQENQPILRIVFFSNITNNKEYIEQHKIIKSCLKTYFPNDCPVFSVVSQSPQPITLIAEITCIENVVDKIIKHQTFESWSYITIETTDVKILLTQGIIYNINGDVVEQSENIFTAIGQLLAQEKIPLCNIVRQWNYIENITGNENEQQCYQLFNNARSTFYTNTQWIYGYPAATGIGTQAGGIMVEINAVVSKTENAVQIIPINNTLQIAAHDYSKKVLVGEKTTANTPKFERAKYVRSNVSEQFFISGTASIRGEKTVYQHDVKLQTKITIENILHLLTKETFEQYGVTTNRQPKIAILRVYIKNREDIEAVIQTVEKLLPAIPTLYVQSDVCRPELLVEIEAIANFVS